MHKALVFGTLATLGIATQAMAQETSPISYSYLEADYVSADLDGISGSTDGFGVSGSIGFSPMLHGFVDYTNLSYHGITIQGWEVGLGFNHSLTPTLDFVARAGYLKAKVEDFGSDDGFGLQAGVRAHVTDAVELEGLVHYTDLGGGADDTSLKVAARYFFMPQFSVGAGLEYDNDATVWNAGFRYTFAK